MLNPELQLIFDSLPLDIQDYYRSTPGMLTTITSIRQYLPLRIDVWHGNTFDCWQRSTVDDPWSEYKLGFVKG